MRRKFAGNVSANLDREIDMAFACGVFGCGDEQTVTDIKEHQQESWADAKTKWPFNKISSD